MAADLATKGANNPEMVAHVQNLGILKEGSAERRHTPRPMNPFSRAQGAARDAGSNAERKHRREGKNLSLLACPRFALLFHGTPLLRCF